METYNMTEAHPDSPIGIIEAAGQQTALTVFEAMTPAEIYAAGAADPLIDRIEKEVAGRKFDVNIEDDRKACASLAFKLAKTKTSLDGMGKKLTEEWRQKTAMVNAERTRIVGRLQILQDTVRAPLTEWELAEKKRKEKIQSQLDIYKTAGVFPHKPSTQAIIDRLEGLRASSTEGFGEFTEEGEALKAEAIQYLMTLREQSMQADAEREELAQARAAAAAAEAKLAEERRQREAEEAAKVAAAQAQANAIAAAERRAKELEEALEAEKVRREQAEKAQAEAAERSRLAAIEAEERAKREAEAAELRAKQQAEEAAAAALRAEEERAKAEQERIKREAEEATAREQAIAIAVAKSAECRIKALNDIALITGGDASARVVFEAIESGHIAYVRFSTDFAN
jgi:hypothetical protein